jgi:hypothetical protein
MQRMNHESGTSLSLLQRIRDGDQAGWRRVVELYSPLVYHWCRRWGADGADADDVAQEVFQAASASVGSFRRGREGDTFRGWLRGITRNKVLVFWRGRGKHPDPVGGSGDENMLGNLTVVNSFFLNNSALGNGGGPGGLLLLNDTINGNSAGTNGGGVSLTGGAVQFQNTIAAGNVAGLAGADVFTAPGLAVSDLGGNLLGTLLGANGFTLATHTGDPLLGPLQNNGGSFAGVGGARQIVQTEALRPGSPAIGLGTAVAGLATDERGFPGIAGGRNAPSAGAFEPQLAANATHNQAFVESVYETLLNRVADPGGLAGWTAFLDQGLSPVTVVLVLESSPEYRADAVQAIYQRYLHRDADAGGLAVFAGAFGVGLTDEQIAGILISSPEYDQLHGGSVAGFVTGLYEDGLGRAPDFAGSTAATQALATGGTRIAVAGSILGSPEYRGNQATAGYQSLLGRDGDPAGLAAFAQLLGAGMSDEFLTAALIGSPEGFANRR